MRWNRGRRQANAGPVSLGLLIIGLCPVLSSVAFAQDTPSDWRGLLLSKAENAMGGTGSVERSERAIKEAIEEIDALVGTGNEAPDHVHELADSIVMQLYAFDASLHLRAGHPANATVAFRQALERAQRSPRLTGRARELVDALASAQKDAGDGKGAMATYDEAVKKAEKDKDPEGLRGFLLQKGLLCSELGDYQAAIEVNERILAIDQKSGDIQDLIGTELRLSGYYDKVRRKEAFQHAASAYKLAEESGNDVGLLQACDLLISSFQTTSENDECKAMLDQAMAKAIQRGVPSDLAKFHDRYGRFQVRAEKYDDAIKQFQLGLVALNYTVPSDNPATGNAKADKYLAELLLDMGQCYRAQHDTAGALMHLAECERLIKANPEVRVVPWADLGELYLQMGDVAQATEYGTRALTAAEETNDTDLKRRSSDFLYRVYKRQGNAVKALAMHELFMATSISKEAEEYKLELQHTQISSKYHEKQYTDSVAQAAVTEGYRQQSELRETRTHYLIYGGIALFLAGAIVALFDRKRRMARFDREAAQLETQALRSQMNPHFIFNALNSINAFVQKNEPDKAASFLSRFARLMRLVLENSRQTEVPLKDDLEALDAYLHLERTRTGEKFDYRIQVAADIDPEDVMVPPLVAQPFVENAIWHGMSGKEEKGMITLSVSRKGDQLLFAIEDDGVGRSSPKRMASMGESDPADGPTKKTSLGTAITKARLDLVRQQKGKAAGFIYVDLPQGTRVELTLPFSTAA